MQILKNKITSGVLFALCWIISPLAAGCVPMSAKMETDSLGNAVAVWELRSDSATIIQAAVRASSGNTWSTPQQISPVDSNSVNFGSYEPKLAINSQGQAVAIWRSVDPTSLISNIYASTIMLQASSTWTTAVSVSNPNEAVQNLLGEVPYSAKVSENGKATVLWQTALQELKSSTSTIVEGSNTWSTPAFVAGTQCSANDNNN